jgi:hypothetical protein
LPSLAALDKWLSCKGDGQETQKIEGLASSPTRAFFRERATVAFASTRLQVSHIPAENWHHRELRNAEINGL